MFFLERMKFLCEFNGRVSFSRIAQLWLQICKIFCGLAESGNSITFFGYGKIANKALLKNVISYLRVVCDDFVL